MCEIENTVFCRIGTWFFVFEEAFVEVVALEVELGPILWNHFGRILRIKPYIIGSIKISSLTLYGFKTHTYIKIPNFC
jgi:hypothetical protein